MNPTGEQLADYLGQLPQSEADLRRFLGILAVGAVWILAIYFVKRAGGEYPSRVISNGKEPKVVPIKGSNGYIYDVNNNKILTMDMNPINEGADIFVPKYKSSEENKVSNKFAATPESITEVNATVNFLVKNDKQGVFEYLKKISGQGIAIDSLSEKIVLELDKALSAKISGETNRTNVVLSQIISHWSREKTESVISGFLSIMETKYVDKVLGAKVELLKMMKS
ncbi:MAG TPA: hypothetical protein VJI33_03985 [Candidatus Paceibacterota bacterium]